MEDTERDAIGYITGNAYTCVKDAPAVTAASRHKQYADTGINTRAIRESVSLQQSARYNLRVRQHWGTTPIFSSAPWSAAFACRGNGEAC